MSPYGVRSGRSLRNVHERVAPGSLEQSAELLAAILDPHRTVWPLDRWPALRLDWGLEVGSAGGHGLIRYSVVESEPHRLRFAMTKASPVQGWHELSIERAPAHGVRWRHELVVDPATTFVRAVVEPLHDALLEDLLDGAVARASGAPLRRLPLPRGIRARRALIGLRRGARVRPR